MIAPHLVLGGPGCGKTTRLLDIVARELEAGLPASQIAFVTFTKAAAEEAKLRAAKRFSLDPKTDLPWFRTLHSLAYAQMKVTREEVMDRRDWGEFGTIIGEPMSGYFEADGMPSAGGRDIGDVMLRIVDYAATTQRTLLEAWHVLGDPVDWFRLARFASALAEYKKDSDKVDFTDMIVQYARDGAPVPVTVAVIDEAQDLTAAQWAVARRAFATAERVFVGGDDDQAIYHWAGADIKQFLGLSVSPEVLPLSHRLPRQIFARAQQVAARISHRYTKPFQASPREGEVLFHQYPQSVDLAREGTWFLLARNNYMLGALEALARDLGVNYMKRSGPAVLPEDVAVMKMWERLRTGRLPDMNAKEARSLLKLMDRKAPQMKELERHTLTSLGIEDRRVWFLALSGIPEGRRDYYQACLRRGEKLDVAPRVRIETIHGVKGAEADHVLLMTDLSHRTQRAFEVSPDAEHRVFYVGMTRALHSLHVVLPQSDMGYPLA